MSAACITAGIAIPPTATAVARAINVFFTFEISS
jgi:hypothetical protein